MANRTQNRGKPPAAGELWLHGRHTVAAALANPSRRVCRLLQTEAGEAEAAARRRGIPVETVERRLLDRRFGTGAVHQGIALHCEPLPPPDLDAIAAEPGPARLLLLDRVSDPRNVGAVLRSAAAFGVRAVIMPAAGAPAETAALAKAAAGALERVPLARTVNLARTLERLKAAGYWFAALDGTADLPLARLDLTGRIGLVLGAEGAGIRRLVRRACDFEAAIPMSGNADSLNVAVAAGIALYEAHRQTYMSGTAAGAS
ncbi:MAG: 23S rRNA (guanosine(2251)-2'-O)-methyltransferase RlmB [Alphaproteobacteria bacterium]|nr:23S rRNA (guanosine(2251)-2'-O)-methyltransferase RlmB [Alphaproteobacteria bacterium]